MPAGPSRQATELTSDPFAPFRAADPARPFVVAQLGQSLDGRIATVSGASKYINGEPALDHLHRMRAEVDAVVVGAGTIAADDPQLTVRRVNGRNPARVVIDPAGRLRGPAKWLDPDGTPCCLITHEEAPSFAIPGMEHIRLPITPTGLAPRAIIDALFARGYRKILIEGGAKTISIFLDAGCLDRLHLLIAPIIIGSGRNGLEMEPIEDLTSALRPVTQFHALGGNEILIDCDLRNTAGETT